eukprot:3491006-Amphidinium_carterae.1
MGFPGGGDRFFTMLGTQQELGVCNLPAVTHLWGSYQNDNMVTVVRTTGTNQRLSRSPLRFQTQGPRNTTHYNYNE